MCGQISGCQGVDNGKNCTAQGCGSETNAFFFFDSNLLCSRAKPYVTHDHLPRKKGGELAQNEGEKSGQPALQKPRRRHLPALLRGQLDDSGHPGLCQARSPGKTLVVHILTVVFWPMGDAMIPKERGGRRKEPC